jgi:hypothetical protein
MLSASNGVSILLTDAVLPSAPTNAFPGAVSESSATAANWSHGVAPTSEHIVVFFSPEYAQRELDWVAGSTDTVAGWRQPYAFLTADTRVMFYTTPATPLTITGDCLLNGGYWVHEGPSATPMTAVAVNIGGDLTVGAGAQINVGIYARGFGYIGSGRGASAGGSINLTTAELPGNGAMSVDGGLDEGYGSGVIGQSAGGQESVAGPKSSE